MASITTHTVRSIAGIAGAAVGYGIAKKTNNHTGFGFMIGLLAGQIAGQILTQETAPCKEATK